MRNSSMRSGNPATRAAQALLPCLLLSSAACQPVTTSGERPTGPCPKAAAPGAAEAVLTPESKAVVLSIDGDRVWWGDEAGNVWNAFKSDGSDRRRFAEGVAGVHALVVTDGTVYWQVGTNGGELRRASLAGGDAVVLGKARQSAYARNALVVDDQHVFWGDLSEGGGLWRASRSGEPLAVQLAPGAPTGVAVDDTDVYWLDGVTRLFAEGKLFRVPKAGGQRVEIAAFEDTPGGLVAQGDALYWGTAGFWDPDPLYAGRVLPNSAAVYQYDYMKTGRGVARPLLGRQTSTRSFAGEGGYLYWVNSAPVRMRWDAQCFVNLALPLAKPVDETAVALDATHFWFVDADGAISRVKR